MSDLLVAGFGETCEGRSQFELVMGGGVLSLGLAAGGPLRTLNKERGTDKRTRGQSDYFNDRCSVMVV